MDERTLMVLSIPINPSQGRIRPNLALLPSILSSAARLYPNIVRVRHWHRQTIRFEKT
jgi:hypothetical protein